jgi:hypothetical protein
MEKRFGWWLLLGAGALLLVGGGAGYYIMTQRMTGPRWDRLLPEMKTKALALLTAAEKAGLSVMFWEGWRDPAVEVANIASGTSKLKDPLNSMHVWGSAVDIVFKNAAGMPEWPPATDPRWKQLAQIAKSLGLVSGGLAWGWDWDHFQLPGNLSALRSTYGTNYLAYIQRSGATVA